MHVTSKGGSKFMNKTEDIIEIENVMKHFKMTSGFIKKKTTNIKAVDGVSLSIKKGEILGIVGESGSGKTTLARMIIKLIEPTKNTIRVNNIDIKNPSGDQLKQLRKDVSMVFQDPAASLNPRVTVGKFIMRPLLINGFSKEEAEKKAKEMLVKVKLDESYFNRYPHQLSGGQQQRISVARALILKPKIVIFDEPTSALDISVQAQVLNLMLELHETYNLTYIIITHDLNVVRYISDRVAVMYLGKLVEVGETDCIFDNPKHPYTKALISSAPILDVEKRNRNKYLIEGEPDSLIKLPKGCRFITRCTNKTEECSIGMPKLVDIGKGHYVACYKHMN